MTILDSFGGTAVILMSVVLYVVSAAVVWSFGPKATGKTLEQIHAESRTATAAIPPVLPAESPATT